MGFLGQDEITEMMAVLAAAGGGVTVVRGSTSVHGLRDREAVELFGQDTPGVRAMDEVVHVASAALPNLTPGTYLTVDGTAYRVRDVVSYGDGALLAIHLRAGTLAGGSKDGVSPSNPPSAAAPS